MPMTSGQRVTTVVAAFAILSAPLARAQQGRPSFRASARVVEVSIVVTDRDGNPVTGLTAADFQIFDDDKPQKRLAALRAAVASPIDASGLGLTLRIDSMDGTAANYRLMVRVDPGAIGLEQRAGESRGALDVIVAQIRADGADAVRTDHTVDIRLSGDRVQQFLRSGLSFDRTLTLMPDAERVRIVVRDVRTGALGAIGVSRQQLQAIPR